MELKAFIEKPIVGKAYNPWEYNFEFECEDLDYAQLPTFQRYFTYKMLPEIADSKINEANEFIKKQFGYKPLCDPDGWNKKAYYKVVIDIYVRLWGYERNKYIKDGFAPIDGDPFGDCIFGSDTMNSVQNVLKDKMQTLNASIYYMTAKWYREQNNDEWKDENLCKYVDYYHTLGNFVLVPKGFNAERAQLTNDYWDKSLYFLKTFGYGNFAGIDENITKYVNYFFLWDYVNSKNGSYEVKPVGMEKINDKRNMNEFLKTSVDFILRRGKFMTAMLIILEQNSTDLYKEIQDKFFNQNDKCFDGINDAAKKILEAYESNAEMPDKAKSLLKELGDNII